MLGSTKRSGQSHSSARASKRQRGGRTRGSSADSAVEAASDGAGAVAQRATQPSETGSEGAAGGPWWPGAPSDDTTSDDEGLEGPSSAMDVQYAGFRVPAAVRGRSAWRVPRVDIAEVSSDPEWFWREYVCRRKPVVISGLLPAPVRGGGGAGESKQNGTRAAGTGAGAGAGAGRAAGAGSGKAGAGSGKAGAGDAGGAGGSDAAGDAGAGGGKAAAYEPCFEGWTNAMLRRKAGDAQVSVERRDGPRDRFGRGVKVQMRFAEFLDLLEAGDENHYLPAQELPVDEDGEGVGLFAPPMDSLAQALPWRPHVVPFLVPQQLNMWMGNARDGSSSGLHHDYHDNLYVLLRGRKRFTIFSPADAGAMEVNGRIRVVHPNGLITYQGAPSLRADGVAADAAAEERRKLAEERLAVAEAQLEEAQRAASGGSKRKPRDASEHKGASEARVSAARAAVAAAEEEIENALEAALTAQLEQAIGGAADEVDMEYDESASGGSDAGGSTGGMEPSAMPGVASADPQSFSRIDSAELHGSELGSTYPAAAAAHRGEAALKAGEMLYLPAGWFHEVRFDPLHPPSPARAPARAPAVETRALVGAARADLGVAVSIAPPWAIQVTSFGETASGGHLAINYWFHPPDNLRPGPEGFHHPYVDAYWQRDWAARFAGRGGTHIEPSLPGKGQPEVFLGGACDPTTWRFDIAMPTLEAAGVTFYNPQVRVGVVSAWPLVCVAQLWLLTRLRRYSLPSCRLAGEGVALWVDST